MPRDEVVDSLRGFALFGILAVNIQCFVTGLASPSLGVLDAQSSTADHLTVLLTAFLLEFKFYPLFSFCFGYGFAVQTRRWALRGEAVGPRFIRRMRALLFMGMLHGALIWFGDILTRYAIAGHILRRYAGHGPRRLLEAARFWLVIMLTLMVLSGGMLWLGSPPDVPGEASTASQDLKADGVRTFMAYTQGNYLEASSQRIRDYAVVTLGFIVVIPQVMVLFLLGALAAQLGLLRTHSIQSGKHRIFWMRTMQLGLCAGLPINLIHAWQQWQASMQPWSAPSSIVGTMAGELAPMLSLSLVAAFALYGHKSIGLRVVQVLAPAGKMSLTLYVGQSIALAVLLSGFGLGLGATTGQFELFLIAVAVYALQVLVSHGMARYGLPGLLEWLWRRYTYRGNPRIPA